MKPMPVAWHPEPSTMATALKTSQYRRMSNSLSRCNKRSHERYIYGGTTPVGTPSAQLHGTGRTRERNGPSREQDGGRSVTSQLRSVMEIRDTFRSARRTPVTPH